MEKVCPPGSLGRTHCRTHRSDIEIISQFVELEQVEAGVGTTEVLPFPLAEELVPAADEAEDDGQMNTFDQGEQSGIAPTV